MGDSTHSDADRERLRAELGFQRWEAIGHFLTQGDCEGFSCENYRDAIAHYQTGWELLCTPWQRQTAGLDILLGIADFALRSEDSDLARETYDFLAPLRPSMKSDKLQSVMKQLKTLAGKEG